ncbi:unnamed protein product [Lymnaea stagnalis]|uniref:Multivesicular body subunit 12B n=1 Tax=Lymnaea stagnalis TaxID=6523 RepID=A0AAV2IQK4_LYMST
MDANQDLPILSVCIVSDPCRCPANHILINKTFDRPEDADLWSNGLFTRRIMRYLCIERQLPTQNQDVLVDVQLISDKESLPAGFTIIDYTTDTKEKAYQKKLICVRMMASSMTQDAITDLIFLSRGQRKPPQGYTLVPGDINNMGICYKMGRLPQIQPAVQDPPSYSKPTQLYTIPAAVASSLPYSSKPPVPVRPLMTGYGTATRTGPPEQSSNNLATSHVNPISGIEWKMNQKYKMILDLQKVNIPVVPEKSLVDLERQYTYDFSVERSVAKISS